MSGWVNELWGRVWRFAVTGVVSNVALYLTYVILVRLGMYYPIALTACYALGMLWGYYVNRLWTWRDEGPVLRSMAAYVAVYIGIYVAHVSFVAVLVEWLGQLAELAALISLFCFTLPLFFLLNNIVYLNPKTRV